MDTFDVQLSSSFDQNASDANSFVDFFQQQQDQQQSSTGGPSIGSSGNHIRGADSAIHSAKPSLPTSSTLSDANSPTSTLLRSSASPTSRDQFMGLQSDSVSTTVDSPSSLHQAMPSGNVAAAASNVKSNTLHPNVATPVRHNSLPFEQMGSSSVSSSSSSRPVPSSRQMSMNALSTSNPNSPSLQSAIRSPFNANNDQQSNNATGSMQDHTNAQGSGALSSPGGAGDYLNPNAQASNSPSPLRTSVPFTSSPDSSLTSPTMIKAEDQFGGGGGAGRHSPMVPSQPQGSGSNGGGGGNSASADSQAASTKFVHKLFRMVSDPEYQHLISWNANGTSVVVTNFDEFAKDVLGKHFKHSNFSSFIRQLNMYGFYKVNKTPRGHRHTVDTQVWEFSHPKFLRGRPDLLDDIRRKALDSEHARVEARDLQYTVSVGHMALRQQVDEQQYRLEEMYEMNAALRQMVLGLRDSLGNVLEWIKSNNNGQLPFDARLPKTDLPPTPMMQPFMAERPPPPPWATGLQHNPAAVAAAAAAAAAGGNAAMMGHDDLMGTPGDGPSIFITEPGFAHSPHDVFSMNAMAQVSPMASRRVSAGSQASERMDMPHHHTPGGHNNGGPRMSIDTSLAAGMGGAGNPGLGVMGLAGHMNGEMQIAINTPLPPSPAVPTGPHMGGPGGMASGATSPYGGMEASPFFATSPSMPGFPGGGGNGGGGGGYFGNHVMAHGMPGPGGGMMMVGGGMPGAAGGMMTEDDGSMLGPNAKAMRTQIKRTASNSGSHQMAMDAAQAMANVNQQKRKSPGI